MAQEVLVTGDSLIALEFLQSWAVDGPWFLTAIDPEKKQRLIAQTFDKQHVTEALAFIEHWNGKRNLYFSVNVPKTALNTKAEKKDIGWFSALHVDVDPEHGMDHEEEKVRILEKLRSYEPKPSVILFSGGGYQGFWLLHNAIEVEGKDEIKRLESYNKGLEKALGGDHCHNIDRIMRLPGTVNLPDPKKRAKGRVPALASVVEADWTRLFKLDDFKPVESGKDGSTRKAKEQVDRPPSEKYAPPDWVPRVLENGPDHEGPRSYNNDRSKALWAVCCALIRANWSDEEIAAAILDKENKLSEHVYAQSDPEKYARRQASRAREKAGGDFIFNDKGQPVANQYNVRLALSKLDVSLSYDEFSRHLIIEGPDALPKRRLEDKEFTEIYLMIAREFNFRASVEFFKMIIDNECHTHTFHPVREYFDSLKWDGKPRIDAWLITYGQAVDNPFTRAVSALSLIAAVRRIRQPGCKFDEIVVLESEQGFNKSSALAALATRPEWFTDSMPLNAADKEMIEALSGKWIVESPELKGMRRSDVEHHKATLSRQVDRARLSYGRYTTEVPRQCIFFGTTNADSYLRDTTGNRRFWPIKVKVMDVAGIIRDCNQLWAEAAAREEAGESIRLNPDLYGYAALEQQRRTVDDPWESLIEQELAPYKDGGKILGVDMWNIVSVPIGQRTQEHNARLGDAMRKLGWERKKTRFVKGSDTQWGYVKGDAEIKVRRIFIERVDGSLQIHREGDEGAGVENGSPKKVDNDIPF